MTPVFPKLILCLLSEIRELSTNPPIYETVNETPMRYYDTTLLMMDKIFDHNFGCCGNYVLERKLEHGGLIKNGEVGID